MIRVTAISLSSILALSACGGSNEPSDETAETSAETLSDVQTAEAQSADEQSTVSDPWPPSATTDTNITSEDFAYRIAALADDRFGGRAPASELGEPAADWIAAELAEAGLEPAGEDGTWFQDVPLLQITLDEDNSSYDVSINGESLGLELGADAVYWSQNADETISLTDSELVFVGYGVNAPEYGWNDYEGLDVEGKTVVMLINDPGYADPDSGLFNGNAMTYYGRWTYKYEEAARQGAEGAIIVHQTEPASYPWEVVYSSWTGSQSSLVPDPDADFVDVQSWIQEEVARELFSSVGLDFDELAAAAVSPDFQAVPMTGATLSAELIQSFETNISRNVLGRVDGVVRPEEYVLFMAHWDHLGQRLNFADEDQVYNGAVDNASGTAGVMEIAELMAGSEFAPERSAIFIFVTAEEQGLLGSEYYANNPLVPLDQTVGGFNFDSMPPVGPTEDVVVVGYGASELEDILEEEAEAVGRYLSPDPTPEAGYFYRSDHVTLARKGVPMIYADGGSVLVDGGIEAYRQWEALYRAESYHKPADEFDDSWDLSGLVQDAQLMHDVARRLMDSDDWPNWYEGNEFKGLRDAMMDGAE